MALVRVSELLITLYDIQDFKMCAPSVFLFVCLSIFCNSALCERSGQSLHTKNKIVRPNINTPNFLLSVVVKKNISSCRIMSYIFFLHGLILESLKFAFSAAKKMCICKPAVIFNLHSNTILLNGDTKCHSIVCDYSGLL